ncbi:MAG: hypothetical protein EOP21_11365 [Hyphomicrobiales bacterium]|nr:MAG: hypothetical protein EOP21_11365 [Hyphomicrobiales bacterium]
MNIASLLRAGAIGLVLAATALPAQAASLHFQFGNDLGYRRVACLIELTDSQIRRAVAAQGYRNIYLNVANDRRIQIRATKGDGVYLLKVSTCTGRILERDRLRHS